MKNLDQVADELARRLTRFFCSMRKAEARGVRRCALFNNDPYWRDLIPFHEYFHGDTGRGCGASHQTGWTGLIAEILIGLGGGSTAIKP